MILSVITVLLFIFQDSDTKINIILNPRSLAIKILLHCGLGSFKKTRPSRIFAPYEKFFSFRYRKVAQEVLAPKNYFSSTYGGVYDF